MSVYKRPGQTVYSYDFVYRRERFSGSTGCTTKRDAEKFEEAERKRVAGQQIDATKPMSFKAAAAQYWNEVGSLHANEADTLRSLDWLEGQIKGHTPLSSISDATVAKLVAKRRGDGVSNATVNRTVTQPLRAILKRASKTWKQQVHDIDWKAHFLKEAQERVREASQDEEKRLMEAMRGDYAPALRFAILSGCRRAEIVGLQWKDVNFFTKDFTVTGKGEKSRVIPMSNALYELLWSLKDDHKTAVFSYICKRPGPGQIKGQRYPITMEGFKTEWRRTLGRAKVENYRFHDNRHTAATRLVRASKNIKLAQRLLGHTDIATTTKYAHVTHDDLRAAMEATSPTEVPTKDKKDVIKKLKK